MSSEILRRASALMRERAEAATEGPWHYVEGDPYFHPSIGTKAASTPQLLDYYEWIAEAGPFGAPNAEHIASWHPAVALAVADWIDSHASDLAGAGGHLPSCDSPGDVQHALVVARAYLGESA